VSVEAVIARVNELQLMIGGAGPTAPSPASTAFASQLASATAAPTATTATAATATATATPMAATGASELPADVPYGAEITAAAKKHGLDPALLAGLVKQESGFNPNAGSPAGARGLTQLMPGTAAGLGVTNVLDPVQSLEGGAKYLRQQLDAFGGDVTRALAAYNAGPGAVQRYGGVPPYAETQNYVQKVQAFAAAYRGTPTGTVGAATAAVPSAPTSASLPYSTV
jgi:soluble lytic murein transglycosylase-like protein